MRLPKMITAGIVAAGLLLAGCGQSSSPGDPAGSAYQAFAEGTQPAVTGDFGDAPKMDFAGAKKPEALSLAALSKGDGRVVATGDLLFFNYQGQIWDGEVFDDSFTDAREPLVMPIGVGALIGGFDKTLVGQTVGSRVLISVPSEEGYGDQGSGSIKPGDTIVFVVDVLGAYSGTDTGQADAAVVPGALPENGPQVSGDPGSPATVTVPEGAPEPTELTTTVIALGTGEPLKVGPAAFHYAAATWSGQTNSTWGNDAMARYGPVGNPNDIFKDMVGIPIGSRVVIQVPKISDDAEPFVMVIDVLGQPGI